ncbi:MAG: hypothetical protein ABJZ55_17660 [Fuerstiella sp.]
MTSKRSGRWGWPTWTGIGLLLMSAMCVTSAIFKSAQTYTVIAKSMASPKPSELAEGIIAAQSVFMSAPLLFVVGLILLLIGLTTPQSGELMES